ncbi:hypothetical protein KDA_73100 [Dictyobacter alpinus]|uniref:HTH cro/C1-type domain-containing protein n=1 Tax=Dictyobacter alpinus TaxID=2014873 RepID=A0A402BKH1_9CHLR|nr:transcriptional regulator [Dictyobacter alpinus]GCE31826.1 hypothetical protein KDA_73100 [Dictyobacter alpinus]
MQMPIGEFIRQARRQRGLTQTELGNPEFSKSYVSAVERGQITPSYAALHFFALQLNQPAEELEALLDQSQKQTTLAPLPYAEQLDERMKDQDAAMLLNLIQQGQSLDTFSFSMETPEIALDPTLDAWLKKHARAVLLKGLLAQEHADFAIAQTQLEYALALSSNEYKPMILDALGNNAYLLGDYAQSLNYYLRALQQMKLLSLPQPDLLFRIELHSGHALRLLGQHEAAQQHYTEAHKHLRPTHNMKIAGQLYLGLGYSTYAFLFQAGAEIEPLLTQLPQEKVEEHFRQSLGYLLQSRTLFQVGSDWDGEVQARLSQAAILLDLCSWRQHQALLKDHDSQRPVHINATVLLDDVTEQCRQILLRLLELYQTAPKLSVEHENIAYMALAYFIRSYNRRATIARLGGDTDTAMWESSLAAVLSQHVSRSLEDQSLSWAILNDVVHLSGHHASKTLQPKLYLPYIPDLEDTSPGRLLALAELYFATGEVSEEIAYSIKDSDVRQKAYNRADQCFVDAITVISKLNKLPVDTHGDITSIYEPGYMVRFYQRYLEILKQREKIASTTANLNNTQQIQTLLNKAILSHTRPPYLLLTSDTHQNHQN